MSEEIKEILENIKCPQFGSSKYGKWGSLPIKVRIALKRLCEYANACDEYITLLHEENERLNNIINEFENGLSWLMKETDEKENEFIKVENMTIRLIYDILQILKGGESRDN